MALQADLEEQNCHSQKRMEKRGRTQQAEGKTWKVSVHGAEGLILLTSVLMAAGGQGCRGENGGRLGTCVSSWDNPNQDVGASGKDSGSGSIRGD